MSRYQTTYMFAAGASATVTLTLSHAEHTLALYYGATSPVAMNQIKGLFGEKLGLRSVWYQASQQVTPVKWTALTPHRDGAGRGIDILFARIDRHGRPTNLMVADAKFGSSRLGDTKTGRQMSSTWIRPRLARTARLYTSTADAVHTRTVVRGTRPGSGTLMVPLPKGGVAKVWVAGNQVIVDSPHNQPTAGVLEFQLRRMGKFLNESASGHHPVRSRLFHVKARHGGLDIKLIALDTHGIPTGTMTEFAGTDAGLLPEQRDLVRGAICAALRDRGVPEDHVDALAKKIASDPSLLNALHPQPVASWRIGIDRGNAMAATAAGLLAGLGSLLRQLYENGTIEWKESFKLGALSAVNASIGYYVGAQVHVRLITTPLGRTLMSSLPLRGLNGTVVAAYGALGAGAATSVFFALGAYWFGLVSAYDARVMATAGVAGVAASVLFTSGAFGAAAFMGTASTGTAISALSGGAFTNAALAWMGGGAISAGGLGIAAGTAILSGGTALIGLAVTAGVQWGAKKLREAEQGHLIEGRLQLVQDLLRRPTSSHFLTA